MFIGEKILGVEQPVSSLSLPKRSLSLKSLNGDSAQRSDGHTRGGDGLQKSFHVDSLAGLDLARNSPRVTQEHVQALHKEFRMLHDAQTWKEGLTLVRAACNRDQPLTTKEAQGILKALAGQVTDSTRVDAGKTAYNALLLLGNQRWPQQYRDAAAKALVKMVQSNEHDPEWQTKVKGRLGVPLAQQISGFQTETIHDMLSIAFQCSHETMYRPTENVFPPISLIHGFHGYGEEYNITVAENGLKALDTLTEQMRNDQSVELKTIRDTLAYNLALMLQGKYLPSKGLEQKVADAGWQLLEENTLAAQVHQVVRTALHYHTFSTAEPMQRLLKNEVDYPTFIVEAAHDHRFQEAYFAVHSTQGLRNGIHEVSSFLEQTEKNEQLYTKAVEFLRTGLPHDVAATKQNLALVNYITGGITDYHPPSAFKIEACREYIELANAEIERRNAASSSIAQSSSSRNPVS